jgi:hypothetical protein
MSVGIPSRIRWMLGILATFAAFACTLEEITVESPRPQVQAEIYLRISDGVPSGIALLYATAGSEVDLGIGDAQIVVTATDGRQATFRPRILTECVEGSLPPEFDGACYRLRGSSAFLLEPGGSYQVRITWPGGGGLQGTTTLPGDFSILQPRLTGPRCHLPPGQVIPVRWAVSRGARAYISEAEIRGLTEALKSQNIEVPTEPLTLLGLAISESDTEIAFPSQFGIFNRLSSDRDVLAALQRGLPSGSPVEGRIVVSAQDRNTVNWNRGGNFNPSGQVRTPSLFGDGGGVLGGIVNRSFGFTTADAATLPSCLP